MSDGAQERFIVTVKQYNEGHNPRDKKTGVCLASTYCTDKTGHHHSMLFTGLSVDQIKENLKGKFHITRIEAVV